MTIEANQKERLDYKKELLDLNSNDRREVIAKTLVATALIVAAVVLLTLFHTQLLAIGIAVILVSGTSIFNYISNYVKSNKIFTKTTEFVESLIDSRVTPRSPGA